MILGYINVLLGFLDICCLFLLLFHTNSVMYKDQEVDVNGSNPYLLTVWLSKFCFSRKSVLRKLREILADVPVDTATLVKLYKRFDIDFMETGVIAFIQCISYHGNSND